MVNLLIILLCCFTALGSYSSCYHGNQWLVHFGKINGSVREKLWQGWLGRHSIISGSSFGISQLLCFKTWNDWRIDYNSGTARYLNLDSPRTTDTCPLEDIYTDINKLKIGFIDQLGLMSWNHAMNSNVKKKIFMIWSDKSTKMLLYMKFEQDLHLIPNQRTFLNPMTTK